MTVSAGNNVAAAVVNAAFMSRTSNTSTTGDIAVGRNLLLSVTDSITAFAGGGQASATALTKDFNIVSTVATAADSVKLPSVAAGASIYVHNRGANALAVYGQTGDQIDGGSANASVSIPVGEARLFRLRATNQWLSQKVINPAVIFPPSGTLATTAEVATKEDYLGVPATNGYVLASQTDGTRSWVAMTGGGGSGTGGINYAEGDSGTAEVGTGDWDVYADGAATPVDGDGGTPSLTITRTTTNPIRGDGSLIISSGAQGDGAFLSFAIDRADLGQVLRFSADLEYTGTCVEGDYTIWFYDETNSSLIQPTPYKLPGYVGDSSFRFIASFQVPIDCTQGRILIHQAVSTPGGDLKLDNVIVGPESKVYGPVVSEVPWNSPTGSWNTNVTYLGKLYRIGNRAYGHVRVTCSGAPSSGNLTINLPFTIDTAGYPSSTEELTIEAGGNVRNSATGSNPVIHVYAATATSLALNMPAIATHSGTQYPLDAASISPTVPFTFGASDYVEIWFSNVPVLGWGGTNVVSEAADTRALSMRAHTASTSIADNATTTVALFTTKTKDSHVIYDSATGRATATMAGTYRVSASVAFSSNGTGVRQAAIAKNGTVQSFGPIFLGSASFGTIANISDNVELLAGDYIDIRPYQNSGGSLTLNGSSTGNFFTVTRLSGPAQIAASEKVTVIAKTATAQSISESTTTTVAYGTVEKDTHGAWNASTYIFTAPRADDYIVKAQALFANAGWTAGGYALLGVAKNGTTITRMLDYHVAFSTSSQFHFVGGETIVPLNAGDTIRVRIEQATSGGGARLLHNDDIWNHVTIVSRGGV